MTGVPPQIDLAAFEADLRTLLDQFKKQQERNEGLSELMQGLLILLREHRLRVPGELSVLLQTLGVLDGVAHQMDSNFRMMDAARPFAHRLIPERYGPGQAWKSLTRVSRAYGRLFDQFPVHVTRALRRAGEGEFRIAVRPSEYEHLLDRLSGMVSLLAYAVIVGALIIGFAFLVARQGLSQPELIGYRVVLFLAVGSVVGLLGRLIRNEWRKRRTDKRVQR